MPTFTQPRNQWLVLLCLFLGGYNSIAHVQTCLLAINPITISSGYSVSSISRATVSAEIAWSNARVSDIILIATGTQSPTITPGMIQVLSGNNGTTSPSGPQDIVSPQIIAVEIDADGASGLLTASFSTVSSCTASASYNAPSACQPVLCQVSNLGGRVFNNDNADGILDLDETNGVPGLTITVFPCTGGPLTAISNAFGNWQLTSALTYPVRVEFTNIPAA